MTKDEALKLAKECGATTYTNRHYPDATAVTFSPLAREAFCEQALAAQRQWVGLTDAEKQWIRITEWTVDELIEWVNTKLKEKNT